MILFCISCDSLFSTREPEPPEDPRSQWIPPLNAEQVLINLQSAIFDRNVENFSRCLSQPEYSDRTYRFDPDPDVALTYGGVYLDWSLEKEEAVMQQGFSLVPADSVSLLIYTEDVRDIQASDSAVFVKQYRLELHHIHTSLDQIFEGQAEFWLAPDQSGEWSIYRWKDERTSSASPWSLLKASLGG